jgi:hypothetical protein
MAKKGGKLFKNIILVIVFLLLVGIVIFSITVDGAVRTAVEYGGKKTMQVEVYCGDADVSFLTGGLKLRNIDVNNPPGYNHKYLLKLKSGDISVNAGSLFSDTVEIKDLKLDGMELVIEQKVLTNNLQEVLENIKSSSADSKSKTSGKNLLIENLEITGITVKVKVLPVPGQIDTIPLKLSPIKMKNLGSDSKLDIAELSAKIMLAIAVGIAEQGVGVLPKELLDGLGSTLGTVMETGGQILGTGQEIGEDVIKGVGEAGKNITEGLTEIFAPKKDEQE